MNCWDPLKAILKDAPCTSVELADELGVSVRTINARLQFYRNRGLVKHNGRTAPSEGFRGRRAKFWVLG